MRATLPALVLILPGAAGARPGPGADLLPGPASPALTAGRIAFAPQPGDAPPAPDAPASVPEARARPAFGEEGGQWWTFGAAVADDFDDATDFNLHVGYSLFLADRVEFTWENAAWYFDQEHDDAAGFSSSLVFRWHFVMKDRWSLYADAGVGGLLAGGDVPEGGTGVNLLPRLGAGVTWRLGEGPSRLQAGLRWHHISNARLHSDENNPSRDAPLLYAGLIVPF